MYTYVVLYIHIWLHIRCSNGYVVLTKLINVINEDQSIEKYLINPALHQMILDSTHNVKRMISQINVAAAVTTTNPDPAVATATAPVGADTTS